MTDLTVNSSLANKGRQSHKSIGANGTFWLPPEMQSSNFEANLKRFTPISPKVVHQNLNSHENHSLKFEAAKESFSKESFRSNLDNSGNGPIFKNFSKGTIGKAQNAGISSNHFNSVKAQTSSLKELNSIPSPLNSNAVSNVNFANSTIPSSNLSLMPTLKVTGNALHILYGAVIKKDGIKDAFAFTDKHSNETYRQQEALFPHASFSEDEAFEFLQCCVSGSLSFGGSHNGVVRFAFSMEDGSSVSVRLEKKGQDFQVCFISESSKTLNHLSQKFTSLNHEWSQFDAPSVTTMFFSSYKEMDKALLKQN